MFHAVRTQKVAGGQRHPCLMGNRQFVGGRIRFDMRNRPGCRACGGRMHAYKREPGLVRLQTCHVFKPRERCGDGNGEGGTYWLVCWP